MSKYIFQLLIAVGIAAQFAVPGWMIIRQERILRNGTQYRFRIEPIDPFHAFKGRYVQLRIPGIPLSVTNEYFSGEWIRGLIATDTNGLSRIAGAAREAPEGQASFRTRVRYCWAQYETVTNNLREVRENGAKPKTDWIESGRYNLSFNVPFSEYYLPEKIASAAEDAVRDAASRENEGKRSAVALVRILDGRAAIEGVEIDGIPLLDFVEKEMKKNDRAGNDKGAGPAGGRR